MTMVTWTSSNAHSQKQYYALHNTENSNSGDSVGTGQSTERHVWQENMQCILDAMAQKSGDLVSLPLFLLFVRLLLEK